MWHKPFEYLKQRLDGFVPDTAVILGSGIGKLTEILENPIIIPYTDIPTFPQTKVEGHAGCFYAGKIGKHNVLFMQGRFHLYEGLPPHLIAIIVKVMYELGVKQMIITNAAGSLRSDVLPGSLMVIRDHINMSGCNPLAGIPTYTRFTDMNNVYDKDLRQKFMNIAKSCDVKLHEGVYLMVLGPNYETASEILMYRGFGADVIGMSTVQEAICAKELGIKVLCISIISNLGTGLSEQSASHTDVLATVAAASETLESLLKKYLQEE